MYVGTVDIACEVATGTSSSSSSSSSSSNTMSSLDQATFRTGAVVAEGPQGGSSSSSSSVVGIGHIGNLMVAWRYVDDSFMLPFDIDAFMMTLNSKLSHKDIAIGSSKLSIRASDVDVDVDMEPSSSVSLVDCLDSIELVASNSVSNSNDSKQSMPLTKGTTTSFDWLYRLLPPSRANDSSEQQPYGANSALDNTITATRVCEMIFSVPSVSVCKL